MLSNAVKDSGHSLQLLYCQGAGPDHPVQPGCPESSYLKTAIGVVSDNNTIKDIEAQGE
jgi:23S rRNA G2069 N7-methylase RlmK/C1962 C5-methylase RlmI